MSLTRAFALSKFALTVRTIQTSIAAALSVLALNATDAQIPVLQREFTIGCADCGGALQFSRIDDLALSARGEFMVVDGEAPFLRQFDEKGKLTWQGGPKGKGPGEYSSIGRVVFLKSGSLSVVDVGGMRVTALSAAHALQSTTPLTAYATTTAANVDGTILLGAESPRGAFTLTRFRSGVLVKLALPKPTGSGTDTLYKQASIAIAPNGTIAVMPNNDRYEILRMDSSGAALPAITRAIARVRQTPAELARQREGSQKIAAQMKAMTGGRSTGEPRSLNAAEGDLPFKSHVVVDGLRFDASGRLWVLTMRGNESSSLFDVFAATGAFIGTVTIPESVKYFAVAGSSMLTASENKDGIPVVTKWSVR